MGLAVFLLDQDNNPEYDFGENQRGRTVNVNRPVLQPSNLVAPALLNDIQRQRYYSNLNGYVDITFFERFLRFAAICPVKCTYSTDLILIIRTMEMTRMWVDVFSAKKILPMLGPGITN
jgi:hypothetical protein